MLMRSWSHSHRSSNISRFLVQLQPIRYPCSWMTSSASYPTQPRPHNESKRRHRQQNSYTLSYFSSTPDPTLESAQEKALKSQQNNSQYDRRKIRTQRARPACPSKGRPHHRRAAGRMSRSAHPVSVHRQLISSLLTARRYWWRQMLRCN